MKQIRKMRIKVWWRGRMCPERDELQGRSKREKYNGRFSLTCVFRSPTNSIPAPLSFAVQKRSDQ